MKPTSSVSHVPRVFVLGDSISMHYGPYLEKFLGGRWRYERKAGAVGNIDQGLGANGGDSSRVLEYLRQRRDTGGIAADWLLLNCGLHDIKTDLITHRVQVERAAYEENLRSIVATLRELQPQPIWVRTTPVWEPLHNEVPRRKEFNRYGKDVDAYNASADRIMAAAGIPSIDLHTFTATFMPAATSDGVHFNDDVRQLQGAFLAGALMGLTTELSAHTPRSL